MIYKSFRIASSKKSISEKGVDHIKIFMVHCQDRRTRDVIFSSWWAQNWSDFLVANGYFVRET